MQHNLTPGLLIKDRYKLMQRIGQGSFGEVWLADDLLEQKYVAIKMYQWLDRDGMDTFAKEMETTKDLSHPNLLIPSEFNEWNQRPFFVMEYCGKGSVSQIAGTLTEDMAWRFIRDVSSGLAYLHGLYEPIVHQDVKPYNIVMGDDNHYKITDFGISTKVRDHLARHSDHRNPNAGALAYMAPERFTPYSSPLTASDIWAFGVTIYELLSGRLPFNGMGGGMLKGGAEIPHLPTQYSPQLDHLVTACLQKQTWDRPTAAEIERYAGAMLKGEMPVGRWELAAAAAMPIAPGISAEIREMGEQKNEQERNKDRRWMVVAAAVIGIVVVGGLIRAAIDKLSDGKEPAATEVTAEDSNPDDNLLADNIMEAEDMEAASYDDGMMEATEAPEPEDAMLQDAPNHSAETATGAASPRQREEDAKARQPEAHTAQPSTAGSGTGVADADGYRGPEDTGRPQNQVNRSDYRGQDRNGFVSRDASANPASRTYTADQRYKKRGDALPQPAPKAKTAGSGQSRQGQPMTNELRMAISYGDYATLKHFADGGDVNAYVPMADLCIRRNEYANAEKYAKKAQAAGVAASTRIFDVLRKMGYYD